MKSTKYKVYLEPAPTERALAYDEAEEFNYTHSSPKKTYQTNIRNLLESSHPNQGLATFAVEQHQIETQLNTPIFINSAKSRRKQKDENDLQQRPATARDDLTQFAPAQVPSAAEARPHTAISYDSLVAAQRSGLHFVGKQDGTRRPDEIVIRAFPVVNYRKKRYEARVVGVGTKNKPLYIGRFKTEAAAKEACRSAIARLAPIN